MLDEVGDDVGVAPPYGGKERPRLRALLQKESRQAVVLRTRDGEKHERDLRRVFFAVFTRRGRVNRTRIETAVDQPLREPQLPLGRVGIAHRRALAADLEQVQPFFIPQLAQFGPGFQNFAHAPEIECLDRVDERGLAHGRTRNACAR
jgi:hypothetical protein